MDIQSTHQFLEWLTRWINQVPSKSITQVVTNPKQTAILSVDVINGFCREGPLASPRVAKIIPPIVKLLEDAWSLGIRDIILLQDTHEPEAVEFGQFPPHCVRGTSEAETVNEIKSLPFYPYMQTVAKNSIHSGINTTLDTLLEAKPELDTLIVVGDCTDLCTYQLAMHLRLQANARQLHRRVIIPIECVDTYDLSVDDAQNIGALPHPGDLLHSLFLYHMALNGIELFHIA